MKKFLIVFILILISMTACYPTSEEIHNAYTSRLAKIQASPLKEYTFIVDGHEKKICGHFTYEDWSPFRSTYYVGWSDGSLIGQFPVAPTTAFPKPDCKNY
jgi:hypothetical protein